MPNGATVESVWYAGNSISEGETGAYSTLWKLPGIDLSRKTTMKMNYLENPEFRIHRALLYPCKF